MATPESAYALLNDLYDKSFDKAVEEFKELEEFAIKKCGFKGKLKQWDIGYYSEKLKESKYSYNEEELKEYFSLNRVLKGLFDLTKRLFGVDVVEVSAEEMKTLEASTWHKDVKLFKVLTGKEITAYFFFDPYTRSETKQGGAWMNTIQDKSNNSHLIVGPNKNHTIPVGLMVTNFPFPVGDQPSLMRFQEVETVFHEFGHLLQHMLTKVNYSTVSGVNGVEWDCVE